MGSDYRIGTEVSRGDDPTTVQFSVECKKLDPDSFEPYGKAVATLKGFVHFCGGFPDKDSFDIYDERSAHCVEGFNILQKRRKLFTRLFSNEFLDFFDFLIFMERMEVNEELRGNQLSHRLIREVSHVFARPSALAILKAHPDGDNVSDKSCLKLAHYYANGDGVQLQHLSRRALPGWLVGHWNSPQLGVEDASYWTPNNVGLLPVG